MLRFLVSTPLIGLVLPIVACSCYSKPAALNSEGTTAAAKTATPDQLPGKWTGPEGSFLVHSESGNGYTVQIQSLDGPSTYEGSAIGDLIEFVRDGNTESIRAGSGRDTGRRWLLDKKNCLLIKN